MTSVPVEENESAEKYSTKINVDTKLQKKNNPHNFVGCERRGTSIKQIVLEGDREGKRN